MFTSEIALKQIFTTFLTLVLELLDVGIITNASLYEENFYSLILVVWKKLTFSSFNFIHSTKICEITFSKTSTLGNPEYY